MFLVRLLAAGLPRRHQEVSMRHCSVVVAFASVGTSAWSKICGFEVCADLVLEIFDARYILLTLF